MSNLYDIKEIRTRMLTCKPDAQVSINYYGDDMLALIWMRNDVVIHTIKLKVEQVRTNCRVFEKHIHKAKRAMRGA